MRKYSELDILGQFVSALYRMESWGNRNPPLSAQFPAFLEVDRYLHKFVSNLPKEPKEFKTAPLDPGVEHKGTKADKFKSLFKQVYKDATNLRSTYKKVSEQLNSDAVEGYLLEFEKAFIALAYVITNLHDMPFIYPELK